MLSYSSPETEKFFKEHFDLGSSYLTSQWGAYIKSIP